MLNGIIHEYLSGSCEYDPWRPYWVQQPYERNECSKHPAENGTPHTFTCFVFFSLEATAGANFYER
jgi:hypothetical protein